MTLLLGFAAVNTGNNLLYLMVSALLGFMAVSGLMGHWNLKRLDLFLEPADEIYAGVETLMGVKVLNRRRIFPAFLIDIQIPGSKAGTGAHLAVLEAGYESKASIPHIFSRRGNCPSLEVQVSSTFPVNFFTRYRKTVLAHDLTVFPHPLACEERQVMQRTHEQGAIPHHDKGNEGDINRIDDYQGSEPLKMIHWKLTARHENVKVKELSALGQQPININPLKLPGADLEEQLGCATFMIKRLLERHQPVGLKLNGHTIEPGVGKNHKINLLNELARYAQD